MSDLIYLCLGSWSIDRAETENHGAERKESRHKVELKSIRLRAKILSQFQDHLLKKDQFVDDLFIIYRINQEPGSVCVRVRLRTDRTRIFKSNFKSDNKVMKFL